MRVGRNLTLQAGYTEPSEELLNLWNHQVEMSEVLTSRARDISASEPHRAVMIVMASRLEATVSRNADTMYLSLIHICRMRGEDRVELQAIEQLSRTRHSSFFHQLMIGNGEFIAGVDICLLYTSVAAKFSSHMVATLAHKCMRVGRNLTLQAGYTLSLIHI